MTSVWPERRVRSLGDLTLTAYSYGIWYGILRHTVYIYLTAGLTLISSFSGPRRKNALLQRPWKSRKPNKTKPFWSILNLQIRKYHPHARPQLRQKCANLPPRQLKPASHKMTKNVTGLTYFQQFHQTWGVNKCHVDQISSVFVVYAESWFFIKIDLQSRASKRGKSGFQKWCYFARLSASSSNMQVPWQHIYIKSQCFYCVFETHEIWSFGFTWMMICCANSAVPKLQ